MTDIIDEKTPFPVCETMCSEDTSSEMNRYCCNASQEKSCQVVEVFDFYSLSC